jgi:hypothetical protein
MFSKDFWRSETVPVLVVKKNGTVPFESVEKPVSLPVLLARIIEKFQRSFGIQIKQFLFIWVRIQSFSVLLDEDLASIH